MTEQIAILGATGSIGRSTLDVVRRYPDRYRAAILAGGARIEPLVEAAAEFRPDRVVIADERLEGVLAEALKAAGLKGIDVAAGAAAVEAAAADPSCPTVVEAVVGAAGLAPAFAAARAGKRLLLANKESVVCGGALLMRAVEMGGATLLPVDSEHNAIFQCLAGADAEARSGARLILTASGGPFRGWKDLSGITPEMAVKHPKWSMGRKISVDSATLMNKGLEVIEASWLFDVPVDRIEVLVHPESIVHSMVEFADGAVLAQLGMPDMREPIAYSLAWPQRLDAGVKRLRLSEIGRLTFEAPDLETFPLLKAACDALRAGGSETIVLNAANEVAVEAFLNRRIGFTQIFEVVADTLSRSTGGAPTSVAEILDTDLIARTWAEGAVRRIRS